MLENTLKITTPTSSQLLLVSREWSFPNSFHSAFLDVKSKKTPYFLVGLQPPKKQVSERDRHGTLLGI